MRQIVVSNGRYRKFHPIKAQHLHEYLPWSHHTFCFSPRPAAHHHHPQRYKTVHANLVLQSSCLSRLLAAFLLRWACVIRSAPHDWLPNIKCEDLRHSLHSSVNLLSVQLPSMSFVTMTGLDRRLSYRPSSTLMLATRFLIHIRLYPLTADPGDYNEYR